MPNLEKYLSLAYLSVSSPRCLATKQLSASLTAAITAIYSYYCILLVAFDLCSLYPYPSCIISMSLGRWSLPLPPSPVSWFIPASFPMRYPFPPGCRFSRAPLSLYLSITARNQLVCGLLLLLLCFYLLSATYLHIYHITSRLIIAQSYILY